MMALTRLLIMVRIGTKALPLNFSYVLLGILMISPMFVYGANKDDVLVEKYRIAHESRDVEALKAIVHWEGASERTREIIEQRLALHLNLEIISIEFRPLSGDECLDFEVKGRSAGVNCS